jgi:hypothetical protein
MDGVVHMKKKRWAGWLILLLVVAMMISGCGSGSGSNVGTDDGDQGSSSGDNGSDPPEAGKPLVLKGPGNTPSNLLHQGMAAEHDGYIYHIDRMFEGNLWKTSIETGETQMLLEGTLHHINANGGAVFVTGSVPPAENGDGLNIYGIFRIQTDGSGFTVVKEGTFGVLLMQDEYLYFTDVMDGGLYRMKYDGSEEKRLLKDIYDDVVIVNETIYIATDLDGSGATHLYALPLDGSGAPAIIAEDLFGEFQAANKTLYYELRDNTSNTYRYDTVSKKSELFVDKWVDDLNSDGEYLYYYWNGRRQDNEDQGFYKKSVSTGEETLVMKIEYMFDINVAGGKVYWHNNDEQRRISVMNPDGTGQAFVEQMD